MPSSLHPLPEVRLLRLPLWFPSPCNPYFPLPFDSICIILGRGRKPIGKRIAGSEVGSIVGRHPLHSFEPTMAAALCALAALAAIEAASISRPHPPSKIQF